MKIYIVLTHSSFNVKMNPPFLDYPTARVCFLNILRTNYNEMLDLDNKSVYKEFFESIEKQLPLDDIEEMFSAGLCYLYKFIIET